VWKIIKGGLPKRIIPHNIWGEGADNEFSIASSLDNMAPGLTRHILGSEDIPTLETRVSNCRTSIIELTAKAVVNVKIINNRVH